MTGPADAPVVVTDCDHADLAPELAVLEPAGVGLRWERCRTADDVVRLYTCGPTVYKSPHIGHMVGPIIFDAVVTSSRCEMQRL